MWEGVRKGEDGRRRQGRCHAQKLVLDEVNGEVQRDSRQAASGGKKEKDKSEIFAFFIL